jgi:hypothetical protein
MNDQQYDWLRIGILIFAIILTSAIVMAYNVVVLYRACKKRRDRL